MFTLLALVALAAPPSNIPSGLALREAREEIVLTTRRRVKISRDIFDGTVTLRSKGASRISKQLLKSPSALCPSIDANAKMVILHCDSRRTVVKVLKRGRKRILRIERLRGIRARGPGALPRITYENGPHWLGLKQGCPGTTPAIVAECHYKAGRRVTAARLFKEELHGAYAAFAALRLGDISREAGRTVLALGWYRQAGRKGPFARVAMARLCSLTGSCFDGARDGRKFAPLNPAALPPTLRDEVILTGAMVLLYEDRPREAALHLLDVGMTTPADNPCRLAPGICAKISREALRMSAVEPDPIALAFYYAVPKRNDNPDAHEMAQLASDIALALGAPTTSAHLLAASTDRVKARALNGHLELTAERYLEGGDVARARAILAFADEADPKGKARRATLRRRAKRRQAQATVVFDAQPPSPESVRAHGVLFAAKQALAVRSPSAGTDTLPDGSAAVPDAVRRGAALASEEAGTPGDGDAKGDTK